MKLKDILIDIVVVIALLMMIQSLNIKNDLKENMLYNATSQLEQDIKEEKVLKDHYIVYDNGEENLVAKSAKKMSSSVNEVVKIIVMLIGDLLSFITN